ncbi:hypothetical protein ACIPLC_11260 [Kitasatospora sp. NPDC086801]|uniref:hypothetical protein n=1 Tax=Kitasatospora sp. NPDC086801 TaxID=3364066 RepID=UPI00380138F8
MNGTFTPDGSGDPFHITEIGFGVTITVDWNLSPKDLGWFSGSHTVEEGRVPKDGKLWLNYTATRQ